MTVFNMLGEIINYYRLEPTRQAKQEKIRFLLNTVGLHSEDMNKYPHEFSGGQRQRIGIARALIMDPELIICDEPVSALDVSIQAQIINLLVRLRSEFGLTYIFIAHDLGVVKHISDRVAVMYLGKIVEVAPKKVLFQNPLHPYTEALLSAVPVPDPEHKKSRILLKGDVPSQLTIPKGCSFHTRCIYAQDICSHEQPLLLDKGSEHYCSCHFR
jgi:oligopeptide/dipeptide ABC transporter ATP-binding protein